MARWADVKVILWPEGVYNEAPHQALSLKNSNDLCSLGAVSARALRGAARRCLSCYWKLCERLAFRSGDPLELSVGAAPAATGKTLLFSPPGPRRLRSREDLGSVRKGSIT